MYNKINALSNFSSRLRRLLSRLLFVRRPQHPSDLPDDLWMQGQLVHASPSGMILVDARQPDMPIIYVNEAFQQITGYSLADVRGKNCRFLHRDDRDQPALEVLRQALKKRLSCNVTLRNYRKDGEMFWNELRVSPVYDQDGTITHYIGIQNDISRRKEMEQAFEHSELRYRQMFEENRAVKLLIDPQTGQIVNANSAAVDFYGYPRQRLTSMRIQDINVLPDEEVIVEMQRAKERHRSFFEFQHRLASGEVRDVDVFSSPMNTSDGQLLYSIVVDVTGKRQAEMHRERLITQLRFLNQTAQELADLPDEQSLYTYMGKQLHTVLRDQAVIVISQNEPAQSCFTVQGVYGLEDALSGEAMQQESDYLRAGSVYAPGSSTPQHCAQGHLIRLDGGVQQLKTPLSPPLLGQNLIQLLNLDAVYVRGLHKDGNLYACVHFYMRGDHEIEHPDLVEAFIQQVSATIQRIQAVNALQESERMYRSLFEQSNDAVFILNTEGKHLRVNQRASDLLGYSLEEMIGLSYRDLVPDDQQEQSSDVRRRLVAGERVPPYERYFLHKDGRRLPTEVNVDVVRDDEGNPLHIQSLVRDISQRKQMEDALRASEERLRMMIEAIPDLIFRVRTDGTYMDYHAPDTRLLFDPPEVFLGKKINDVLPPLLASQHMDAIRQASDNQEIVIQEYTVPFGESERQFELRVGPAGDDEVLVIARDVTEIRQMQQHEMALVLEKERHRLLTTFIQNAAHEFRTPLSTITSSAYLLAKSDDVAYRRNRYQQIELYIKQITKLIDMLLMMVKLESADMPEEPLAIKTLYDSVCESLHGQYGECPVLHHPKIPDDLFVIGDEYYLRQALLQIIDNAYRYTPPDREITIICQYTDDEVWLKVQDQGPGIMEEFLPRIFETFWRQDTAHTTPGFGLGLTIAKKVVEHYKGRIEVESKINIDSGTLVSVVLPLLKPG